MAEYYTRKKGRNKKFDPLKGSFGKRYIIFGKKTICHISLKRQKGHLELGNMKNLVTGSTKKKKENGDSHLYNLCVQSVVVLCS